MMYSTMEEVNQERRERMAFTEVTGTVGKITERQWKNLVFYSFTLEEGDEWYGMGTDVATFREGDVVEFRSEIDKKGYPVVKGKVLVKSADVGTSAPAAASPAPTSTGNDGTSGKISPKDARYQAIDVPRMSFSAAQDRAVNLVAAALAADALSFGSAAKGKRLDMLLEYVGQVTDTFFVQAIESPAHLVNLQRDNAMASVFAGSAEVKDDSFDD